MYRLVTFIDTIWVFSGTFVRSMKLIKSAVSLRYYSGFLAVACRRLSTNADNLSVGPPQPEMIGRPTNVGLWIFFRM